MQGYGVRVGEGIHVVKSQAFAEQLEKIFSRVPPSLPPGGGYRSERPLLDQPHDLKSEVKSDILAFTIF